MRYKILIAVLFLTILSSCNKDETITDEDETNLIIESLNRQNVGNSANDLLSDNTYTSLIIELVYVEGFKPNENTVNNLVSFIENRCYKPNGINVEIRAIPSPGLEEYTLQDIVNIEMEQRQNYNSENQITVWAFFADGKSSNNSENNFVLGTAYWNTSFVIFEKTIKELSNSAIEPNRTILETTVINHEFGHILGLTDLGTSMVENHEDEEHAKHCNNDSCLMFWTSESSAGIDSLIGISSAPFLDNQCLADLQANGGK